MPYKQDIIPYLTSIRGVAKELGVVNTILKFDEQTIGLLLIIS